MRSTALILAGGWQGHAPRAQARLLARELRARGFDVEVEGSLRALDDPARLGDADLVVPIWTMGRLSWDRAESLRDAVHAGTGLAGFHGTADAFREATEYQFLLGGQFVAHPGGDGVEYTVDVVDAGHPITRGMGTVTVRSERYHLHVDPSIHVLASTRVPTPDGAATFAMPVAWTRLIGKGRIFYSSLGHTPEVLSQPDVLAFTVRGLEWATRGRA